METSKRPQLARPNQGIAQAMEPTPELIDDIYRNKVLRARRETPTSRFKAATELFDDCCKLMAAGIRTQHPEFNDAQVTDEIRRRLAIGKQLERLP